MSEQEKKCDCQACREGQPLADAWKEISRRAIELGVELKDPILETVGAFFDGLSERTEFGVIEAKGELTKLQLYLEVYHRDASKRAKGGISLGALLGGLGGLEDILGGRPGGDSDDGGGIH